MWMYRRLYFVEEWRWIKLFIILQLLIIVILSLFYQVNYFYLGFFTANFVSWFREQQSFRRMFALFSGIIAFTFIINIFWSRGEQLLAEFWGIRIYAEGIWNAVFMFLRIFALITATGIFLTYTTTPMDLTDALNLCFLP